MNDEKETNRNRRQRAEIWDGKKVSFLRNLPDRRSKFSLVYKSARHFKTRRPRGSRLSRARTIYSLFSPFALFPTFLLVRAHLLTRSLIFLFLSFFLFPLPVCFSVYTWYLTEACIWESTNTNEHQQRSPRPRRLALFYVACDSRALPCPRASTFWFRFHHRVPGIERNTKTETTARGWNDCENAVLWIRLEVQTPMWFACVSEVRRPAARDRRAAPSPTPTLALCIWNDDR